jgi:hypothetical protein
METMNKDVRHDFDSLIAQVHALDRSMIELDGAGNGEKLLRIIHGPGWTTAAEFAMVLSTLHAIDQQIKSVSTQYQELLRTAELVGR